MHCYHSFFTAFLFPSHPSPSPNTVSLSTLQVQQVKVAIIHHSTLFPAGFRLTLDPPHLCTVTTRFSLPFYSLHIPLLHQTPFLFLLYKFNKSKSPLYAIPPYSLLGLGLPSTLHIYALLPLVFHCLSIPFTSLSFTKHCFPSLSTKFNKSKSPLYAIPPYSLLGLGLPSTLHIYALLPLVFHCLSIPFTSLSFTKHCFPSLSTKFNKSKSPLYAIPPYSLLGLGLPSTLHIYALLPLVFHCLSIPFTSLSFTKHRFPSLSTKFNKSKSPLSPFPYMSLGKGLMV